MVLRDIPVYEGWVNDKSASFGHNVDEFVVALQDLIDGKVDKREEGYKVAEVARLMMSPKSLLKPTKKYWRFKCVIGLFTDTYFPQVSGVATSYFAR